MSDSKVIYVNGVVSVKEFKNDKIDKLSLNIKRDDLISFLQEQGEWVNIDLIRKKQVDEKGRTHNPVLNNWKPTPKTQLATDEQPEDSGLPF